MIERHLRHLIDPEPPRLIRIRISRRRIQIRPHQREISDTHHSTPRIPLHTTKGEKLFQKYTF